jgi:hypothetical protein
MVKRAASLLEVGYKEAAILCPEFDKIDVSRDNLDLAHKELRIARNRL